ncbi:hypothetical protein KEM54_003722 [Ascosphaera aggregata]|nr:hypothetical protein KEM54_003722 [Ascosphaera aggregata]
MSDAESNAAAPPAAEVEQQSPVAQEGTAPTADSPTAAGDDAADVKEQGVGNEKAGDENGDLKLKDEAKDAAQNSADNEAPAAAPAADDKKEDSATQSIVVVPQQATSTTDANGESTPEKTTTTTTPAPQPTTKKSSSSSKRKSLGGNKRKGASRPLHLDAKPGEYYIARLKSYPPWPSVICDEEMLPPALTAKRPVTTKQPDGTYFEAYADGGKRVYERTFPIMFLGSNEFAWIANTDITPITPEECAAAPEKGKTKGLIEAFKIASEGHDLNYFKKVISDHNAALQQEEEALMAREAEKERKAQKKAEKAAAKAANQQKGKRKSTAAAETDDDDGETEQVSEKKKPSKKRKKDAESDVDTEKPAKTPKTSMKLKLTTPKAPGEKEEKSSTGKKATAAATSAKTSKAKGKQAGDKEVAEDATSKEEKKKKEPRQMAKGIGGSQRSAMATGGTTSPASSSAIQLTLSFLENLVDKVTEFGTEIADTIGSTLDPEAYATYDHGQPQQRNRFDSFAPLRLHNDAKWFVDGCGYFYAVSCALEKAKDTIWILDWWLSPELYLRRPPAQNEQYRFDRMIKAAAERGVKVNVILYKEVSVANPLKSEHSKKALEALHFNIQVFRHPDHIIHASEVIDSIRENFKDFSLSTLNEDAARTIYGVKQDVILYWAHHEKLLIVDGHIAFMGGLDLCFGRWDTNQHSIADAHPAGPQHNIFPGQDFNDARIQDFKDVDNYEDNDVNRFVSPRMGWSDCSVSLSGPVVEDLRRHFVDRWNFIYTEKYRDMDAEDKARDYVPLELYSSKGRQIAYNVGTEDAEISQRHSSHGLGKTLRSKIAGGVRVAHDKFLQSGHFHKEISHGPDAPSAGPTRVGTYARRSHGGPVGAQICRSASPWSAGIALEHSIQNAYARIIRESEHFIYIENQFFITATGDKQKPVENTIGAAIVERILRAARTGERYHVMVNIPSVPGFAGDLHDDSANGTRAIMEFQYNSINRGGYSIMELIAKEGYNPMDYIRFYNLRNYDRINSTRKMLDTPHEGQDFQAYSDENAENDGRWDSVAECYMLDGEDIRNVPWDHEDVDEVGQFVSEELYIHSKVLIADDRTAIIGSANLNDRSQLGNHDSEIAVIVQDPTEVPSMMNGKPYLVSKFAASLRRHLHKKHLGLLPAQRCSEPDDNFYPVGVPNDFDFESPESKIVEDPLSDTFQSLWTSRAHTNTEVYRKVFHVVPDDGVRSWDDYKTFFEDYFKGAVVQAADGETIEQAEEDQEHKLIKRTPPKYEWGHAVAEDFPGGAAELKEELSKIKGTLVEMPLMFLINEDITKTGLTLNALTEPIYT